MTLFIEVARPLQWKPGHFNSRVMRRAWWLYFAIGWLHLPFHEYGRQSYDWRRR